MAENAAWQDATELIGRVAGDLGVGPMLYQEGYSMFEAMSALELMDPKMDSSTGYQLVRNYEERVAAGQMKPIASLTWAEVLSCMDYVERAEIALFEGSSAPQTTLTLHYFYHAAGTPIAPTTAPIPQRFLDLFCKFTHRCDEDVRDMIGRSAVLDEEDYITMNYGWPTGEALREDELLRTAKELLDQLAADGNALITAAQERLRHRRALYMALLALERNQLDAARKHLTVVLNRPQPAPVAPLHPSFVEQFIIRRCEIPAAPRPVSIPDSAAAHKALTGIVSHLLLSLEHCTAITAANTSFVELLARLRPVAGWGQVERARLSQLLTRDEVKTAVVRNYMLECSLPKMLLDSKQVNDGPFLKRAEAAMGLFFTTLCYNRSRSRRRMVYVFDELVQLYADALLADSLRPHDHALYGPFFTLWVQEFMLSAMILHLEAGLNAESALQLYQPRELHWLFFYLEMIQMRRVATLRQLVGHAQQTAKRRKKKPTNDETPAMSALLQQAELHYLVTKAVVCLFLFHEGNYKQTSPTAKQPEEDYPFGSNELRWSTRFYALHRAAAGQVPVVPYSYYAKIQSEKLNRPFVDVHKECTDAIELVKDRVKLLLHPAEGTPPLPASLQEEAKRITRVAVLNGLAISKCLRTKRSTLVPRDPVADFATHPIYPVMDF